MLLLDHGVDHDTYQLEMYMYYPPPRLTRSLVNLAAAPRVNQLRG